jgi:hypothetical protein
MQKSSETDIRHGFLPSIPMGTKALIERLGPFYSSFDLWQGRIEEAFDPNMVSKPTP